MRVIWIYPEPEEVQGIKRNFRESFEIHDSIAKQLIKQGRVKEDKKDKKEKEDK